MNRRGFLRAGGAGLVAASVEQARARMGMPAFAQPRVEFEREVLQEGLSHPWALGLLPTGGALLSERGGRLYLLEDLNTQRRQRITGLPKITAVNQGGLLDVQPVPNFSDTGEIVFAASVGSTLGRLGTEVFRARLQGARLVEVERIFVAEPKSLGGRHFGCRLRFTREGDLVFGVGERGSSERARDLGDDAGKIHRITLEGAPAAGNPYLGDSGVRATIFASGTRNPQGLERHPRTGDIWFHEHGPRGGDEVNLLRPMADYGWPHTTYGRAYSGGSLGVGPEAPGIQSPLWHWVPSIAPSGMDFWLGEPFGESLFVGALAGQLLVRLTLDGEKVVSEERHLEEWGMRIREVRTEYESGAPSALLVLTDDPRDGALVRIKPKG
ncbi:MAG: PQQ-dependent sugar dehydrogenase [Alphaproteobacteria bacterium]